MQGNTEHEEAQWNKRESMRGAHRNAKRKNLYHFNMRRATGGHAARQRNRGERARRTRSAREKRKKRAWSVRFARHEAEQ
jgi:hypothetical protein